MENTVKWYIETMEKWLKWNKTSMEEIYLQLVKDDLNKKIKKEIWRINIKNNSFDRKDIEQELLFEL